MENKKNRILINIDYSQQSIDAAAYISSIITPGENSIVLFHVEDDYFDIIFDDHEKLPQQSCCSSPFADLIKVQKRSIDRNLEKAKKNFLDKDFPKENIVLLKQPIKKGVTRDIMEESHKDYDLLVVGKSGANRISNDITGSVTDKLITSSLHIPLVIVSGMPETNKVLLGYDGSKGADNAVKTSAGLIRKDVNEMQLCHVIRAFKMSQLQSAKDYKSFNHTWLSELEEDLIKLQRAKIEPCLQKACEFFVSQGFLHPAVHWSLHNRKASRSGALVEMAIAQNCGSIIIGRRGHSAVKEFFMGRVGKKVVHMAKSRAVWII